MDSVVGATEKKLIGRMDSVVGATEKKLIGRMDSSQKDFEDKILNGVQKIINYSVKELKDELLEKISHLPTKEEFFATEDKVVGELQKTRDEQAVLTYHVSNHSDEIATLQDLHPNNKHNAAN
jgi:hypothetical protein